jgi:hypothetical protein
MRWNVMLFHYTCVKLCFGSPYLVGRDATFLIRGYKYTRLVKNGRPFSSLPTKESKRSLVTTNQVKRLTNVGRKFVMLVLKPKADLM